MELTLDQVIAAADVGHQNAQHVDQALDLEARIEEAEQRAARSRSCAETRRDEAVGCDRRGDFEDALDHRRQADRHQASEEAHLRTAQAFRNLQRRLAWEARRSAA